MLLVNKIIMGKSIIKQMYTKAILKYSSSHSFLMSHELFSSFFFNSNKNGTHVLRNNDANVIVITVAHPDLVDLNFFEIGE